MRNWLSKFLLFDVFGSKNQRLMYPTPPPPPIDFTLLNFPLEKIGHDHEYFQLDIRYIDLFRYFIFIV